jgi:hypothetical protein
MIAGIMMNQIKMAHRGTPHNYPRIQLAHLCVLAYWESIGHNAYEMMNNNMACVSEDLGELSFSMLARCVLGDHIKSDFVHMDELYKLLPIYRHVKQEIKEDTHSKDCLAWHHTIQPDAVEVAAVAFFFDRMIGEVISNTFRSYSGEPAGYKNRNAAASHFTEEYLAPVYIDNYEDLKIHDLLRSIPTAIQGYFLQDYKHQWPNGEDAPSASEDEKEESVLDVDEESAGDLDAQEEKQDAGIPDVGFVCADWSECRETRYAVVHFKFGEEETYHSGIQVYKVDKLDPPLAPPIQAYYNTFQGKQLLCTYASTSERCISGKWHLHPQNAREPETIAGYSVVHYFDTFENRNFLPETQQSLRGLHTRLTLFEDNRMH